MKKTLRFLVVLLLLNFVAKSQTTYYWVGGNGVAGSGNAIGTPISWGASSWNTAADGTGAPRAVSAGNDILIFDGNSTMLASGNKNIYLANIPRDSCGQLQIINGANVTCVTVAGINQTASGYITSGSKNVTLASGAIGYAVGMTISGTGIPTNTIISSVGSIVNVSSNGATTTSGSSTVILNVGSASIVPGMTITGTGIPANTVITAATTPTIITATGTTSTSTSVTLSAATPTIVVGMGINGSGIPAGTTITAYDGNTTLTLSAATTTAVTNTPLTISTQQTLTLSAAASASTTPPAVITVTTTGQVITLSQNATVTSAAATPASFIINADAGLGSVNAPIAYGGSTAQLIGATGTAFTTALRQGDYIIAGTTYNSAQFVEVLSVNNDNDITISNDAPTALTAGTCYRATMLYIKGSSGLLIDATSTLNMSNTWGSGGNPSVAGFVICLEPGATGNIYGKVVWGYGANRSRLIALSPNAIAFKSGSTADLTSMINALSIYVFGSALGSGQASATPTSPLTSFTYGTAAPCITFEANSNYKGGNVYKSTGTPFGISAITTLGAAFYPAVSFQPYSNYIHTSGTTALAISPYFIGNKAAAVYGNLIFNTTVLPSSNSPATTLALSAAHIDTLVLTTTNASIINSNAGTINIYKGIIINNPSLTTAGNVTNLGNVIFQGPSTPFVNAMTPVGFTTSQFYAGINNISTAIGTSIIPPVSFGTATFQGTAIQTISSTLATAPVTVFTNINISEPASVTLGMNILDTAATGTVNIMGKLDVSNNTVTGGGGNFIVNGLANKIINGVTGGANPIATITAGSTAINAGVSYIPIGAKVTCTSNASYIPANTYVVSYSTAGNYVISNAATYTASGGNGIDSATLALNFTMPSGTLITSNTGGISASVPGFTNYNAAYASFGTPVGSYIFNNTTTSPFVTSAASPLTINNLTLGNGAIVTSNKLALNLSGGLALNSGVLNIPVLDTVRITSGNAITTTGVFGVANYINTLVDVNTGNKGLLRMDAFASARTFPVGSNGNYLPVTITVDTLSSFYVTAFNGATVDGTPNGTALTVGQKDTSVNAIYLINRITPATAHPYTLKLGYPSALKGTTFATYTNQIGISNYNGSTWSKSHGAGDNTANIASDTATVSGAFYITHNSSPTTILPVKFTSISASITSINTVKVSWNVYDEINIDQYIVESATNGIAFTAIGAVKAAGSNTYSLIDNNAMGGIVYYRIKTIDKGTGAIAYSSVVSVALNATKSASVSIYPNPVIGSQLNLQTANFKVGKLFVLLYDNLGKQIAQEIVNYNGGSMSQTLSLATSVKTGTYQLVVTDGVSTINKAIFIIR